MPDPDFNAIARRLLPGGSLTGTERLTGGVSADVYRLDLMGPGGAMQVVLRIHGDTHSGHDADLEFRVLQAVHAAGLPVPEPLLADTSRTLSSHPYLIIDYVPGGTDIPDDNRDACIDKMAQTLADIHRLTIHNPPQLPMRTNPLPEVFDYLPSGEEWKALADTLRSLGDTAYHGTPRLLHGDYWPENLLWRDAEIVAVLDWEDAALGDPLSDVAAARVELRYKFGAEAMQRFTDAYTRGHAVNPRRLALWQIYVAAAAQHFMGQWRLPPERERHMRSEALASIREAAETLKT